MARADMRRGCNSCWSAMRGAAPLLLQLSGQHLAQEGPCLRPVPGSLGQGTILPCSNQYLQLGTLD